MKRIATVLLAGAAAGCSSWSMPGIGKWFSRENAVEVSEVRRSLHCNSESADAGVSLFADLDATRAWETARGLTLIGSQPLPPGPYAVIEMGQRNTGGYGLAVSRLAGRRGDVLILKATFIAPGPDRMVTQMLTSPCVLVSLPQAYYSAVEVIDQSGVERASTKGKP